MLGPLDLLKAPHIGIRELRENLSSVVADRKITVVTDHGKPAEVLVPYATLVSLLTLLGDLANKDVSALAVKGAPAGGKGAGGIAARPSLEKFLR